MRRPSGRRRGADDRGAHHAEDERRDEERHGDAEQRAHRAELVLVDREQHRFQREPMPATVQALDARQATLERARHLGHPLVHGRARPVDADLDLARRQAVEHRDDSIVRGWRSVHVTDSDMPYMGNCKYGY